MTKRVVICLFRNDLRLHDSWLLEAVRKSNSTHILPIYVFDERQMELSGIAGYQSKSGKEARTRVAGFWKCGRHRIRFQHESVINLHKNLASAKSNLAAYAGCPEIIIPNLVNACRAEGANVEEVLIGEENTSEEITVETRLQAQLAKLQPPCSLRKVLAGRTLVMRDDLPFSINKMPDTYTPFRKAVEGMQTIVRDPLKTPQLPPFFQPPGVDAAPGCLPLSNLDQLLPQLLAPILNDKHVDDLSDFEMTHRVHPHSAFPFEGGESAALEHLRKYTDGPKAPISRYKQTRNGLLGPDYSTKFSCWLANGTLSPRTVWKAVDDWEAKHGGTKDSYWVKFELLWLEFFRCIGSKYGSSMFHLTGLGLQNAHVHGHQKELKGKQHKQPQDPRADRYREDYWKSNDWSKQDSNVRKFCFGKTGVPFIDANMRELVATGFMSNRGRQNVASYFTKDMGAFDWRIGAEWFESQLLDYDTCSNWLNWSYQAGVGVDPREERQFNIIKQAKDYDSNGEYVKAWVPELSQSKQPHHPWTLPPSERPKDGLYAETPKFEQRSWKAHYSRPSEKDKVHKSRNAGPKSQQANR